VRSVTAIVTWFRFMDLLAHRKDAPRETLPVSGRGIVALLPLPPDRFTESGDLSRRGTLPPV